MNPEELEQLLIARLNALPTEENRLLYDIDYDEGLVIETAKKLACAQSLPALAEIKCPSPNHFGGICFGNGR
jgi:hypothetical protein